MTVPSWRKRPDASSNLIDPRGKSRKRRLKPNRSSVEQLETRQLLTFSASLVGTTSTFTVGSTPDSVIFSQTAGNLQHNDLTAPTGETFADDADFDSTVAGSQNLAADAGSTVAVGGGAYSATIGTPASPASTLLAQFNLTGDPGSSATIDDSGSTTPTTYLATPTAITATGINVGLTSPSFGNGGVTLLTGTGLNAVNVQGNSSPLTITNPGGTDAVNVGNAGSLAGLTQPLTVATSGGSTAVKVDDSAASNANSLLIATSPTTASLTDLGPAAINLATGGGNTLSILGGTQTQSTVDFSAGNPIPNGLTLTEGGGDNLVLQGFLPGGPFTNETYNATSPGAGSISLDSSNTLFSGLREVVDSTTATNFTFNYTGGLDARISVGIGGIDNDMPTTLISSSSTIPEFAQELYANKTNVTINAGAGNDVVSVAGSALMTGSNTTIDGQGGTNVLNYDAGGSTVVIAPTGTLGQATITRAGSGSLLVMNFSQINVVNGQIQGVPITPPGFVASASLKGTVGIPLTNADITAFVPASPTATAADFGATITWGDGTTTAGTIVPDASNPTIFHVEGSHTYTSVGPAIGYTIGVSVSERETSTTTIPGVTLTQASVASFSNTAAVADAALAATGAALTGVAGQPLTQNLVANFTYAGGLVPLTNFSGTISWGDTSFSAFTSANINTVGTSASGTAYLITADHTYANFGTFPVSVTINSSGGSSAVSQGAAVVADSPITPTTPTPITATEGTPFIGTVASFTDVNATAANFLALITWGDGHVTQGTVTAGAAANTFVVSGTNTFAKAGNYSAIVSIRDTAITGGSTATIAVPVNVADPLTVTILPLAPVENLAFYNLPVAIFTDGGTHDPASKYSATINWGDGSAIVPGEIVANANGSFSVLSSHKYTLPGTFPLTVTVSDDLSGETSATANVVVIPEALNLVGHLNPASDSGESHFDAITNVSRPNFFGTAAPGTIIDLFAIPVGTNTMIPIGSTVTSGSGAWSVTSITLADGRYTIQAMGTDAAGVTKALDVILPNPLQGPLTIDTVAPTVDAVKFEPLTGQLLVTLQDNATGLDQSRVIDGADYSFVRLAALPTQAHLKKGSVPLPADFLVTLIGTTAPSDPASPQDVMITLNNGEPIRGGYYRFSIPSGGVDDVAGNAAASFVADLNYIHNTVSEVVPVNSTANPLSAPGTEPANTFIPTVKKFILVHGKDTLVLADPPKVASKAKHVATKATTHIGKPTPHVKVAAKPHASASKAAKHHG
jgi:Bacterial Ig-like domain